MTYTAQVQTQRLVPMRTMKLTIIISPTIHVVLVAACVEEKKLKRHLKH